MIPLGRSIPNITGPNGAAAPQSGQTQNPSFDALNRRRSSLDAIMGHLKYVGAFPSRVIQDLSQPLSSNPAQPPTLMGMRSQTSLTSLGVGGSFSSLNSGGSMTDLNTNSQSGQQGSKKLPDAEAFLSI